MVRKLGLISLLVSASLLQAMDSGDHNSINDGVERIELSSKSVSDLVCFLKMNKKMEIEQVGTESSADDGVVMVELTPEKINHLLDFLNMNKNMKTEQAGTKKSKESSVERARDEAPFGNGFKKGFLNKKYKK